MSEMPARTVPSFWPLRHRFSSGGTLAVLVVLALLVAAVPAGAGSWRFIGLEGAAIQTLAGGEGVIYTFTARSSLYASADGAASWSARQSPALFLDELVVDPVRPEILYAVSQQSLLQSKDGGRSWSGPLFEGGAFTVRAAPSSPDVVYAARDFGLALSGILKSADGGATWEDANLKGGGATQALAIDPADPGTVYAARQDGVWQTGDGGDNWVKTTAPAGIVKLAIDPRQPSTIYAGSAKEIFKSTDRGATWEPVWAGPDTPVSLQFLMLDPTSGALYTVYSGVPGSSEGEVFRSTDGGTTWLLVFSRFGLKGLALDGRSPAGIYTGTQAGGVYRSGDGGGSWTAANHGLREVGFAAVAADPHIPDLVFAASNMDPFGILSSFSPRVLFRSTDGGATWSSPFGNPEDSPLVNGVTADPGHARTWYAASADGVLKSQDDGETWDGASQGLRSPEFVAAVVSLAHQPGRLYALGWGLFPVCGSPSCSVLVYRSGDGGAHWQGAAVPGLDPRTLLFSVTADAVKSSTVYAAGSTVFRSTDGGAHWTKPGRGPGGIPYFLVADPSVQGLLYAIVQLPHSQGIFVSRNAGATWASASRGLPAGFMASQLAPDAAAPGTVYAATSRGVYVTRNRGKLWTAMNDGLGNLPVWTVAVDPLRPGVVYAGRADGLFVFSEDSAGH